jgi:hypothetical protein
MKLVRLIKMCLSGAYNRARVDKHLSDVFPIWNGLKKGGLLLPLLFNFALECGMRRVQINQNALKLNGKNQFLVHADDVNMLSGSVRTVKKHREALLVGSKDEITI